MKDKHGTTNQGYRELVRNDFKVFLDSLPSENGMLRFYFAQRLPNNRWTLVEGGSACTERENTVDTHYQDVMLYNLMKYAYPYWKSGKPLRLGISKLDWIGSHDWRDYEKPIDRKLSVINPCLLLGLIGEDSTAEAERIRPR